MDSIPTTSLKLNSNKANLRVNLMVLENLLISYIDNELPESIIKQLSIEVELEKKITK